MEAPLKISNQDEAKEPSPRQIGRIGKFIRGGKELGRSLNEL